MIGKRRCQSAPVKVNIHPLTRCQLAVTSHDFQGIEALFSHLKQRAYQFEDTHMTNGSLIGKPLCVGAKGLPILDSADSATIAVHQHGRA